MPGASQEPPRGRPAIHNLAFQRNFPLDVFPSLGLPGEPLRVDGVEFYGQISFLKTAIRTIQSEPRSPSSHPGAAAQSANWAAYHIALRQRGSLTVWFTEAAIAACRADHAPRAAASRATRRWRLPRR
jgi:hypothetical protein